MNNNGDRTLAEIWQIAKLELELQLPRETYITWLRSAVLLDGDDQYYLIGVHNLHALPWLETRLKPVIERTLTRITGKTVIVEFGLKSSAVMDDRPFYMRTE